MIKGILHFQPFEPKIYLVMLAFESLQQLKQTYNFDLLLNNIQLKFLLNR